MKPSSSHGGCASVPLQEQICSDLDHITRFYSSRDLRVAKYISDCVNRLRPHMCFHGNRTSL